MTVKVDSLDTYHRRSLDTLERLITSDFSDIVNSNVYDTIADGGKSGIVQKVIDIQRRIDRGQLYAEEKALAYVSQMQRAVSSVAPNGYCCLGPGYQPVARIHYRTGEAAGERRAHAP